MTAQRKADEAGGAAELQREEGASCFQQAASRQASSFDATACSSGATELPSDIPILQPLGARADSILPYLERIDTARTYTNFGPLSLELGERLSSRFSLSPGSVICASSGTAALMAAILAEAGPGPAGRPLAVVPSFTFAATALAVEHCGYDVVFMDVEEETWALSPSSVRRRRDLDKVGLVVPVTPFGRNSPQEPWLSFRDETGIPVVIDAAASFEMFIGRAGGRVGLVPTALSFHATKSFSTAEGGAVVSRDPDGILRVVRALNFGFLGDRECHLRGFNGKMSEYHAAVGLAELDAWPSKAAALEHVANSYMRAFEALGLVDRLFVSPEIASCYVLFCCRDSVEANRIAAGLAREGIGHRAWYGRGVHTHSHFLNRPRDDLRVTDDISSRLLGLPAGPTLSQQEIGRVATAVARCAA